MQYLYYYLQNSFMLQYFRSLAEKKKIKLNKLMLMA